MQVRKLNTLKVFRKAAIQAADTHADDKSMEAAKKLLDTSAEKNRNLLIAFMAYLATATILALSITDEDLLIGTKTIQLPLLSVGLPMWAFYTVIPLFLVLLYFDVLQNVQEHNKKLDAWWALLSDKARADAGSQLFPYLLDFARVRYGNVDKPKLGARLVACGAWVMYVYLPLLVLAVFFIRFADLQEVAVGVWHLALGAGAIFLLRVFWSDLRSPLLVPLKASKWLSRTGYGLQGVAVLWTFVLWTYIQALHFGWVTSHVPIREAEKIERLAGRTNFGPLVPRIVALHVRPYKPSQDQLRHIKWLYPSNSDGELLAMADSESWFGRRLAFAVLGSADLRKVDLRYVDLQGAFLIDADMSGAQIDGANLNGADLRSAKLRGANLINTRISNAKLNMVNMNGAYLVSSHLQGTSLKFAQTYGADFSWAILSDQSSLEFVNQNTAWFSHLNARMDPADEAFQTEDTAYWQSLWLKELCHDALSTASMLRLAQIRHLPATSKQFLKVSAVINHINKVPRCAPYRRMTQEILGDKK